MSENPVLGQSIGTIEASTGVGTLSYSLAPVATRLSKVKSNPIEVDSSTGELTVGVVSYFDYETRTSITTRVQVTNDTIVAYSDVIITLTDLVEVSKLN